MFFIKDIFLCDEDNILPFITDSLEFWQKQTEINNVVVSHVNVSVVRMYVEEWSVIALEVT